MSITAKIIADSINSTGNRITTFVCTYPRFIHAEILTHRQFSRSSASSRAIPVSKLIDMVESNPAMPIHWGKNRKGMSAGEQVDNLDQERAMKEWLSASKDAVQHAKTMAALGIHKQVVNRVLEPYVHMTTLITATEWGNFFNLRAHKDAQPELQDLAFKMLHEYSISQPAYKKPGEWHLPFGDQYVSSDMPLDKLLKITTARAARVSYLNFEGDLDIQKDCDLHDQLVKDGHMSPTEHAACALSSSERSGNLCGWTQYRKMFTEENKQAFNINKLKEAKNVS